MHRIPPSNGIMLFSCLLWQVEITLSYRSAARPAGTVLILLPRFASFLRIPFKVLANRIFLESESSILKFVLEDCHHSCSGSMTFQGWLGRAAVRSLILHLLCWIPIQWYQFGIIEHEQFSEMHAIGRRLVGPQDLWQSMAGSKIEVNKAWRGSVYLHRMMVLSIL